MVVRALVATAAEQNQLLQVAPLVVQVGVSRMVDLPAPCVYATEAQSWHRQPRSFLIYVAISFHSSLAIYWSYSHFQSDIRMTYVSERILHFGLFLKFFGDIIDGRVYDTLEVHTMKQYKLVEVARALGVGYQKLYYRVATGQTPVAIKRRYTEKDVEAIRSWAAEEMKGSMVAVRSEA